MEANIMEANLLTQHLGEIIVGAVIAIFAWSFRSWAATLRDGIERVEGLFSHVSSKLESLRNEFHTHRMETEKRVTRIETKTEERDKRNKD